MNNRVVTADRNKLGEDTISGLRVTKVMVQILNSESQRMSHLTVKSFLQPDQYILSTKEKERRIKKKMKEREKRKAKKSRES